MSERSGKNADLTLALAESLRGRGVASFGFLGGQALRRAASGTDPETARAYGLAEARGAAVAALPYDTTGYPAGTPDPTASRDPGGRILGDIGWFARSNWYRKAARVLRAAAGDLLPAGPFAKADFRVAVNSRIPEKALAVEAGLGPVGRNTLILDRVLGPGCVLGVLLLPFEPFTDTRRDPVGAVPGREGRDAARVGESGADFRRSPALEYALDCGGCDLCARACPTGAIRAEGGYERTLCIQYWASTYSPVPEEVAKRWRGNLYGCDLCLAACPRFRRDAAVGGADGFPGPGLPLAPLLAAEDGQTRAALKGTALGMGWITPSLLRRNALLAAASRLAGKDSAAPGGDERDILAAAEGCFRSPDPVLSSEAARFLGR